MKIDGVGPLNSIQAYKRNMEQRNAASGVKKNKQHDSVNISDAAKELLDAHAAESKRSPRIPELKQSVEAGTYRVDAGKLAEKLLPFLK